MLASKLIAIWDKIIGVNSKIDAKIQVAPDDATALANSNTNKNILYVVKET